MSTDYLKDSSTLESRITVYTRNPYFGEFSTIHGLIRDIHDANLQRNFENFNFCGDFLYVLSIMDMQIAILCIIKLLYAEICIIYSIFMWDFAEK